MSALLAPEPASHTVPRRVVLLQTQAEAAGAQEVSRLLASELRVRGHEVLQLFFFRKTAAFDAEPGTIICAPERPSGPLALIRMLANLRCTLRSFRPDAVICFQHFGNMIGSLVARSAGSRLVIANHNGMQNLLSRWVVAADRVIGMAGAYSAIVVNSEATEQEYAGYPDTYRRRIVRIAHGFEPKTSRLDRAAARATFDLGPAPVLLGSVARLAPRKHLDAAIRLLPLRPDWHLALAGQGPSRDDLGGLAASLGVRGRLHFVGELSPARIGDFLAALDAFVFPSETETFGLAAVEAAQAGVPVVASGDPALREVLSIDGKPSAFFADVDDAPAFAAAVDLALSNDPLVGEITGRGRRLAEQFPLRDMVDRYESLLVEAGAGPH